jgi:C4-dicarboxylate-specific signal transduction histidine kinase
MPIAQGMPMDSDKDTSLPTGRVMPIAQAKSKTEQVKSELEIASAELHLTNTILDRGLPAADKKGEVAKALEQNEAVENTVEQAAADLHHVKDLLEEEIAERQRLEQELKRRPPA